MTNLFISFGALALFKSGWYRIAIWNTMINIIGKSGIKDDERIFIFRVEFYNEVTSERRTLYFFNIVQKVIAWKLRLSLLSLISPKISSSSVYLQYQQKIIAYTFWWIWIKSEKGKNGCVVNYLHFYVLYTRGVNIFLRLMHAFNILINFLTASKALLCDTAACRLFLIKRTILIYTICHEKPTNWPS